MSGKPIYVVDTHALVYFLKGDKRKIGAKAMMIMLDCRADLVAPIFVFEEIHNKSIPPRNTGRSDRINLPPATALRIVLGSRNIRVFPRSPAVQREELRLRRENLFNRKGKDSVLADQDISICATAAVIGQAVMGSRPVFLITKDARIRKWGAVPTIWA